MNVDNFLFLYRNKLSEERDKLQSFKAEADKLELDHKDLLEVRAFFSAYLDKMTVGRIKLIEETINYGLNFIFNKEVTVSINKEYKGNKTSFSLSINEDEMDGDAESTSGGIVAVISFLFKFVILTKFQYIKFMVLDETFSFVSWQYQERTSMLIRELADKFEVDILLVSHQPLLNTHATTVYKLDKVNKSLVIVDKQTNVKEEDYE